jgi:hypothetical protein
MTLLHLALRNILRRKLRTALTLVGVGVGIAAFVSLVGFSNLFEEQWRRMYESSGTDMTVIRGTFLNTSIDETARIRDDRRMALVVMTHEEAIARRVARRVRLRDGKRID